MKEHRPAVVAAADADEFEIKTPAIYLKALKSKPGEISMHYKWSNTAEYKNFSFKYFDYSDVIFPDTAVCIIHKNKVEKTNYYLEGDSVLVLPLIGVNNGLTIYFINLRTQVILSGGDDLRTAFPFLWINGEKHTFLTANSLSPAGGDAGVYHLLVYKLAGNGLQRIKVHDLQVPSDHWTDEKMQEKTAIGLLQ